MFAHILAALCGAILMLLGLDFSQDDPLFGVAVWIAGFLFVWFAVMTYPVERERKH